MSSTALTRPAPTAPAGRRTDATVAGAGAAATRIPAMKEAEGLEALRARIDALDLQLLELLNARARLAQAVGQAKQAHGDGDACYRAEREAQVLRALRARNPGPLGDEAVLRLFREVMSACLALEQPLRVAYLGPAGTFTQAATQKHFGHAVVSVALGAIDEVFREVESGGGAFGVVPVENSIEGVVNHTLDRFVESPLRICGEVELRIHHHLLVAPDSGDPGAVQRVYAHQQALAQCRRWLDRNLLNAERVDTSSNAEAARRVRGEPGAAAIAAESAAEIYGLEILARNVEDDPGNTTRFLVIGAQPVPASGDDKTSVLFATGNRPGALFHALGAFAEHGINMTRIESRPSRRGTWDYYFYSDLDGHVDDEPVARALAELQRRTSMFKLLGSYPRAVL